MFRFLAFGFTGSIVGGCDTVGLWLGVGGMMVSGRGCVLWIGRV